MFFFTLICNVSKGYSALFRTYNNSVLLVLSTSKFRILMDNSYHSVVSVQNRFFLLKYNSNVYFNFGLLWAIKLLSSLVSLVVFSGNNV
jgi:hypothetical protein